LPNLFELLKITDHRDQREGARAPPGPPEALVGVLATVTDGFEDEPESPLQ
jgi:hypothetical protein